MNFTGTWGDAVCFEIATDVNVNFMEKIAYFCFETASVEFLKNPE